MGLFLQLLSIQVTWLTSPLVSTQRTKARVVFSLHAVKLMLLWSQLSSWKHGAPLIQKSVERGWWGMEDIAVERTFTRPKPNGKGTDCEEIGVWY